MEKLREREDSSSHGLCPLGTAKKFVFGYFLGAIKWWSLLEKKKRTRLMVDWAKLGQSGRAFQVAITATGLPRNNI
jgi:hypothetical protein